MPDKNLSAPLYALVTLSPNRLRATAGVWLPRCVIRASNTTVFLYSHNFVQDFGETPCRVPRRSRGTKGPAVTRQTYLSPRSRQTITLPCTTLHSPKSPSSRCFSKVLPPLSFKLNSPNPSEVHHPHLSSRHVCVDSSARIVCGAHGGRAAVRGAVRYVDVGELHFE